MKFTAVILLATVSCTVEIPTRETVEEKPKAANTTQALEEKEPVMGPSREKVQRYIREHNGSAPPAERFPNGDPFRNLTAEEAIRLMEPQTDKIGNGG